MKWNPRHLAATLLLCPFLGAAQELPSAPSAVVAQQAFEQASAEITFAANPAPVTMATSSSRLNSNQKFSTFVAQTNSPYMTFSSALAASFRPSWNNAQGTENYGSRFGQTISDQTEQGFFTKFLLPSVFHQDPRYYASTDDGTVSRATYAISRIFVTRDDNGRSTLNTSELLGAVLAASLTTAYHPYRHLTPAESMSRAASSMGADAGMNMLREFWPDIREQLIDHGPKVMQGLVTHFAPRTIAGTATATPAATPAN